MFRLGALPSVHYRDELHTLGSEGRKDRKRDIQHFSPLSQCAGSGERERHRQDDHGSPTLLSTWLGRFEAYCIQVELCRLQ